MRPREARLNDLLLITSVGGLMLGTAVISCLVPYVVILRCRFLFEPRDLWVGIFVQDHKRRVYVLPVPMFGLIVMWGHASDCPTSASGCWCGWDSAYSWRLHR